MSHKGLRERVLIEVGRSAGWHCGVRGRSYRLFQRELRGFNGLSLEDLEFHADEFSSPQYLSRGQCAHVYSQRGGSKDRLNPLERYLRTHVGKPWSVVRSALMKVISGRSDSVRHVLDHVSEFVEERPCFRNNVPYGNPGKGSWRVRPITSGSFYVDSKGILREGAARWAR